MRNRMFIFSLLLIVRLCCFAQHCRYCTTHIVGINPISAISKKPINGLYIYVVNENGIQYNGLNSIVDPVSTNNENISKTVLFWQNDSVLSPINNDKKHFNFAASHYLFHTFWHYSQKDISKVFIKIEDRDGGKNGGKFKTKVIQASELREMGLCGYDYPNFDRTAYMPLTVELEMMNPRDSTKVIKTANNFRFEFDISPLINCPECEGCVCKTLQVFNSLEQLVFEHVYIEKTLENNYLGIDSIQVADYTFDDYPDIRIFKRYSKIHEFYVYVPSKKTFEREPLLSRIANVMFDNEKHIVRGFIFDTIPHAKKGKAYNKNCFSNAYTISGKNLVNVMITSKFWYNPWNAYYPPLDSNGVKRDHIDTVYYQYMNYELKEINSIMTYSATKTVGDFKFDMKINLHSAKTRDYLDTYTQDYLVTTLSGNKIVYSSSVKLNKVSIDNRNKCTDTLEVADYNFDGYPDFRICQYSPKYIYKVFDKEKNTFVDEPLLNQMDDIEFDFTNKTAKANKIITTLKKGSSAMNPNADRTEEYHNYMLSGKDFNYVQEYITIRTLKNNEQSYKKEVNYYFYSQYKLKPVSESEFKKKLNPQSIKEYNVPPFIFKMDKNAIDVAIPSEKGAYAYQVEVLNAKNSNVIFFKIFHGNKLKSPFICSDSVQIADFNFDGYPDFRVCALGSNHTYYVYYKKKDTFIEEKRLSELFNILFDYNKKLVTGNKNIVSYDMGIHTTTIKVSLSAEELSKHNNFNNNSIQPKVIEPNTSVPKKDSIETILPNKNSSTNSEPIKQNTKTIPPYQFIVYYNDLKKNNTLETLIPNISKIEVKKMNSGTFLSFLNKETVASILSGSDSIEVDDYDFDGHHDFRIWSTKSTAFRKIKFGMKQNYQSFNYYMYDSISNGFYLHFISKLDGLKFDKTNKVVKGQMDSKFKINENSFVDGFYKYTLSGKGLEHVKQEVYPDLQNNQYFKGQTKKQFILKNNKLSLLETKLSNNNNFFQKTVGNFRFEKETILDTLAKINQAGTNNLYRFEYRVFNVSTNSLIFKMAGEFCLPADSCIDSFDIADYNFDGYPDFILLQAKTMQNYFFYLPSKNKFETSALLNDLNNFKVDLVEKKATGIKYEYTASLGTNKYGHLKKPKLSSVSTYTLTGANYKFVSIAKTNISKSKKRKRDTTYYLNENSVLIPISKNEYETKILMSRPKQITDEKVNPSKSFYKTWKNYQFKLIFNPQDIKPSPVYGSYVKVLEVKDLKKDSIIYSRVMRGDMYKEKAICTDSLLIDDYNFDGYPDYKTCNDYEGKRFDYHLYDSKKNNFVKDNLLSELVNVQLYPDSFKLVGFRMAGKTMQDVWMIGKGFPSVKIFSKTIEANLAARNKVNTYVYKDGRLNEVNTPMPYKVYSKIKDGYRFQVEFNPTDIKIPSDVGSYVKRLRIYKIEANKSEGKVFETNLFANELKETIEQRDSFEIANYNFDKIPDVRFNNSFNPEQSVYYLSAIDVNEDQLFYYEQSLSNLQQIKYFEDRKKLTGTYTDKTDYNTVSFYGKYLDTMVVVKQNLNTLAITQTITYLNKLGKLKPIPNIKAFEPKPKTKKEFGDYNFDGYEDFRTKKKENDERSDFFIYNSKKQSFEIDTLLSKMTSTYFDFENKFFVGQITKQINEIDTYTEGYKTVNGKIILYSTSTCHRKYRLAEGANCTILELKDGKWVETIVQGAE